MGMLDEQVAIVTGGSMGIGLGVAQALSKEGAAVVLAARTESTLQEAARAIEERGGTALPVVCDIREADQVRACVDRTIERFGRLGILVNNAQIAPYGFMLDLTEEAVEDGWRSGPLATFRFMRLAYPHLKARGGVIVNMGSGAQLMHDGAYYGAYDAVKGAIGALTRTAAVEWGKDGIRAYFIMPAAYTPMTERFKQRDPARYAEMVSRVPLGRFGDPEVDIGRPIAWLCSEEAGYITGTTIMLDGGQMYLR
jgi:NAD(P)-dependent dehydrogenase (short-subunit alcohol dehydrogenase family)